MADTDVDAILDVDTDPDVDTDADADADVDIEDATVGELVGEDSDSTRGLVIRHVLERQLVAGQSFGAQLVEVSTDVSVALAHAPVSVVDEIRRGATLPAAVVHTGKEVRGVVSGAGSRVRTAVGEYVGTQAVLPNAVVVGAADVAEAVLRAQGTVAASAIDAAFTVATVATRGGDVPAAVRRERYEVLAQADAVRADVGESWSRAGQEIRGAVKDYDVVVDAFSDDD